MLMNDITNFLNTSAASAEVSVPLAAHIHVDFAGLVDVVV